MLEIKDLTPDLYDSFITFIDEKWRRGHIFTYNREIFDFQHRNEESSFYNFLVATSDGKIAGVFGYIPVNHYDKEIDSQSVWGAIWKVTEDAPVGLGLRMLKMIIRKYTTYGAIGLSQDAVRMYKALGYTNGVVNQYYIINPCAGPYKIAKTQIPPLHERSNEKSFFRYVNSLEGVEDIEGCYAPVKSVRYFVNRYEKHPIYKYKFLVIDKQLLVVYRVMEVNEAKCLRIVDILGDMASIPSLYGSLLQLLADENAEYIDCLNFGLDPSVFGKHGFARLNPESCNTVIPNYFEPFEQRNVVLYCGHNSKEKNYTFFKGDADQDRPNSL